jgi:hypothetical protein
MKSFKDLNIKTHSDLLIGEKVKISKVLNKDIVITGFKIEQSKYPKNKSGKCLCLQIELEEENRVIFTGSDVLINIMEQVNKGDLPIQTKIIQEGEHYEFK